MKTSTPFNYRSAGKVSAAFFLSAALLTGCATPPSTSSGAIEARSQLTALQSDPEMARHARVELREAEEAVQLAEQPLGRDQSDLSQHRLYMANSKIEIARAKASAGLAEADRAQIGEQRADARLAARTRQADQALQDAQSARRSEAASRSAAATESEELRRQIEELEARPTERGLVLTLGDVLFATGSAQIQGGSNPNLDKLVRFLKQYPDRDVLIEGHTDNVGSAAFNQRLSEQRAESVRRYLTERGIERRRIAVSGVGFDRPIASNESAGGRQQNRRVEVVIENGE